MKELDKIKQLRAVKAFSVLKRYFRDDSFKQWINDYDECCYMPKFYELGKENPEKNVFIMKFDNEAWGFFAYWRFAIVGLAFADRFGMTPVIDWTSNSPYYERGGVDGVINPFEYYFLQPAEISLERAYSSYNVCYFSKHTLGIILNRYDEEIELDLWARLTKKYIKLKPEIDKKIKCDISSVLKSKTTLAVQIRGVEWGKISGHPIPVMLDDYVDKITQAMKEQKFEQLFLATDSDDTVNYMQNKFPSQIVLFKDVARAPVGSNTLAIFDNAIQRENNKFLLGYEVLRDMMTLSYCNGLIASYSNISLAAEIWKLSRDETYQYKYIFATTLNKKGISPQRAVKMMKRGKF